MAHVYNSFFPLIVEVLTYIFVVYGLAGIAILLQKKQHINILTDGLYPGLILYLTFFVVMRWIQLPQTVLILLLIVLLITGYAGLSRTILRNFSLMKPLIIFTTIFLLIYIGFYLIPSFVGGVDSKHYAMDMAWAMNLKWLKEYAPVLGWGSESLFVDAMNFKRAATSALGWLNNLSGITINLGTVQRHISFYILLTLIQFWRIALVKFQNIKPVHWFEIFPFLLILLGAHYLQSIASLGQLNAALGIFLLVSIVLEIIQLNQMDWKWKDSWRLCLLTLILLVSYTELIVMLPLFVMIAFLFPGEISIKRFLKITIPISLGIFPVFIIRFHEFLGYFLQQSQVTVGAYPLGVDFIPNSLNIVSNLLGNTSYPQYSLLTIMYFMIVLVLLNSYGFSEKWIQDRSVKIKIFLLWLFLIYYVSLASFSMAVTTNQNYILFKLSSWTASLFAIALFVLWLNVKNNMSKYYKISIFMMISLTALFSGYNSGLFLARYLTAPAQPVLYFISSVQNIALKEPEGDKRLLYDMRWVENLAPWNNISVKSSEGKSI